MGIIDKRFKNVENYSFEDLFDIKRIQVLQEAIARAVGVGLEMVTPDGRSMTTNSMACDFCHKVVRSSEQGRRNCQLSDQILGRPNKEGPIVAPCLSAGLLDAGASIMIGDTHVASWLLGQVRDADHLKSEEENRKRAVELGIDPDLYCSALDKVPMMTKERFTNIVNLVYVMATQLSELGLKNYLQKEELLFRAELEQKLTYTSQHDALTNLYNRKFYEDKVSELISGNILPVSVVIADANCLKICNDIFGHAEGDKLLQQIAIAFTEEAKEEYYVCRCGGDEFSVLMPNADVAEAADYIRRVRERCKKEYATVLPPSFAIGCDTMLNSNESLQSTIKWAEDRMYLDKHKSKCDASILDTIREIIYDTGYLTKKHTEYTKKIMNAFAEYINLDDYRKDCLHRIQKVQNLGLIVVPKKVLKQANEFIDYQLENQYSITEVEYRLAKIIDECQPIARIIAQSHEQWDGNGRPNRLKGTKIDFLTRFISVTNCYAILVASKPRGFGYSKEIAIQKMKKCSGTILDPELLRSFLEFIQSDTED